MTIVLIVENKRRFLAQIQGLLTSRAVDGETALRLAAAQVPTASCWT